jgi:hypothetical protein
MRAAWLALVALLVGTSTMASSADATRFIDFGTPGPPQTIAFADDEVHATLTYRIAPDRSSRTGPAAVSPSISAGTLTIVMNNGRRTYDLAEILANREERVVFPVDPHGSCGADRALSRSGGYLVVEAIITGKGCEPTATFVELQTGQVAQPVVFDPRWLHRFDPTPEQLTGTYATVVRTEAVSTTLRDWQSGARMPWQFLIVHVADAMSGDRPLQIDRAPVNAGGPIPLSAGSRVLIAPITAMADYRLFAAGPATRILQPSLADEARYDALQTPTPHDDEREIRRGLWLDWSDDAAYRGDFAGAVSALAMMLRYDDSSYAPGEAQMLAQCRKLLARVNAGAVTAKAASAMFTNGCVPLPQR